MDVREKLVELLDDIQVRGEDFTDYEIYGMRLPDTVSNEDVASHLIAHGVTVQEWISVKDRLPEEDGEYITMTNATGKGKGVMSLRYRTDLVRGQQVRRWHWLSRVSPWEVTHWMPLPEQPKGE